MGLKTVKAYEIPCNGCEDSLGAKSEKKLLCLAFRLGWLFIEKNDEYLCRLCVEQRLETADVSQMLIDISSELNNETS